MIDNQLRIGDRVLVMSQGPFRGLRGTIRQIHCIDLPMDSEALFLFYQIDLEGAYIKEPIWIQHEEIMPIGQEVQ